MSIAYSVKIRIIIYKLVCAQYIPRDFLNYLDSRDTGVWKMSRARKVFIRGV